MSIVNALKNGPIDFELILKLRKHCAGVRHVFNPEVALVLEYLKGHGVVSAETKKGRTYNSSMGL